jgi:6-phosphogluconolactonase
MSLPPLRIAGEGQSWAMAAAEEIAKAVREAVDGQGAATVVLTGGRAAARVYETLGGMPYLENVDWSRVSFFWGDERCVPPDSGDSNYGMAQRTLLERLPARGPVHRIPGERGPDAADGYARTIREASLVTGDEPPAFDVVLLGMGEDGHVASLFPDSPDLETEQRWVVATTAQAPPAERISMTLRVINAARRVIFLVAGEGKAEALRRVLEPGPMAGPTPPAALVRPADVLWIVDRPAASMLKRK